jgi:hypothetical protein
MFGVVSRVKHAFTFTFLVSRHADFLPLIIQKQQEVVCSLLPALVPHPGLLMRLLLVKQHEG